MAITQRVLRASPEAVFAVLLDPYLYSHWVVGSKAIRKADMEWPAVGSAFYHRVGTGGFEIKDKTEVLQLEAPYRIELRTYARGNCAQRIDGWETTRLRGRDEGTS